MIPYIPTEQPMTGEEQEALVSIFEQAHWYTPSHRLRLANDIIKAGFRRTRPRKVTKLQLWSYASETILLVLASLALFGHDEPFLFGGLTALAFGTFLTFIGGLVINHEIKTGARK